MMHRKNKFKKKYFIDQNKMMEKGILKCFGMTNELGHTLYIYIK